MIYPDELKLFKNLIIDTHAHYDDEKFDGIRDELLCSLNKNGVDKIVTCAVDGFSAEKTLALAEKYDFVYAAVGIHPGNLQSGTTVEEIRVLSSHEKCVAIGEIGLDYYWTSDNRKEQLKFFEDQIILANELDLPIIVHDRDAHADTLEILKHYKPQGVLHCFSGSTETAMGIIKLGMYIGVGGIVTFKNAKKLPEVIKAIPKDRLLLETDCPYLAPEPYRGKLCHSGYIALTAQKVAEILGTKRDEVLYQTRENAKNLFGF
ncbi:MAG: TatD family hydrolase [Clostridia bacterium]|nr:TatD family hydrolase [Clostridia bacterium]